MKISLIIPLFEASYYLENLVTAVRGQKGSFEIEFIFPVTTSLDSTLSLAKTYGDIVFEVSINEFNHGITRHIAAEKSTGDILVFMTQDALPVNDSWLFELTAPLIDNECDAVFARQVPYKKAKYIEKLIREFNYPESKRICSKKTESIYGRKNAFFSDTCSAINRTLFFIMGGYDFLVPLSEDSLLAAKLIRVGYKIGYIPRAQVYHSHNFTLKQNYQKYYQIGQFEAIYSEFFSSNFAKSEGCKLLLFLLKNTFFKGRILSFLKRI
ncbi:MAG: glycosyltransferase [Fusobacteria bacterium]|nr:glycosyltransferase [Fusobacteriota bacterium]